MIVGNANSGEVKPSQIWLAAWMAAEQQLPPASKQLIEAHDALHAGWREAGWPSPVPEDLNIATKAIEDDPLASIAFEFRRRCNQEGAKEWRESEAAEKKEAA
jgi:hypothetical protein